MTDLICCFPQVLQSINEICNPGMHRKQYSVGISPPKIKVINLLIGEYSYEDDLRIQRQEAEEKGGQKVW